LLRVTELARQKNGESVVITFWPHPRMVLGKADGLKLLSTLDEKITLLRAYGVDHTIVIRFDAAFSQLSSSAFVQQVLIDQLATHTLVIGYDHRFGKNREGSFEYLKDNAQQLGFEVEEIPKQMVEEADVSSTLVRHALIAGDVATASAYLGRPYQLTGEVVKGNQIGRKIDFPTANVHVENPFKLIPHDGIYAVKLTEGTAIYNGMLNIGFRPTIGGVPNKTIEANLFDFDGDLYGKKLTVSFVKFLRSEQKFENLEALKSQLALDKTTAKKALEEAKLY
jgi:riboflavin kinase / FMN adenylyltransferase